MGVENGWCIFIPPVGKKFNITVYGSFMFHPLTLFLKNYHELSLTPLIRTEEPDESLFLSKLVLGDALVCAEVIIIEVGDLQFHFGPIGVVLFSSLILFVWLQKRSVASDPRGGRQWRCLAPALQVHIAAQRREHYLIRYFYFWTNCQMKRENTNIDWNSNTECNAFLVPKLWSETRDKDWTKK